MVVSVAGYWDAGVCMWSIIICIMAPHDCTVRLCGQPEHDAWITKLT